MPAASSVKQHGEAAMGNRGKRRGLLQPVDQDGRERHQQHAKQQREHGVQQAFERGQAARAVLDHEVGGGDRHFQQQRRDDHQGPRAVPFAPGQRQEQEDVDELARGVQREFDARGATAMAGARPVRDSTACPARLTGSGR